MKLLHIAIHPGNLTSWNAPDLNSKSQHILDCLYQHQIKNNISALTINLTPYEKNLLFLKNYIAGLLKNQTIDQTKTRIFVLGNWYDQDPDLVDLLKRCMEKTKEYDGHFLNLCLHYNGQDEIVTALKILAKKIEAEKLDPARLTPQMIKENLPTSYFPPPNVILHYGEEKYSGLLLWDSPGTRILYTEKHWKDFDEKDLKELEEE